jgi:hypothetical protein
VKKIDIASIKDIDRMSLCWNRYLVIQGYPRVLLQSVYHLNKREKIRHKYFGWTFEAYPISSNKGIGEIRISKKARPWSWLLTTFNSLSSPGTFMKVGLEEKFIGD